MKITATALSVAALTMLSGAALAYRVLPPMKGAPIQSAAMTTSQTPPSKHAAQPTVTALQQCKILEHRFDNTAAAVSSTGNGESIMKVVLSKAANDLVATGHSAQQAADAAVAILSRRTNGRGGLIVVDRNGGVGSAFTTKNLVRAFKTSDDPAVVIL